MIDRNSLKKNVHYLVRLDRFIAIMLIYSLCCIKPSSSSRALIMALILLKTFEIFLDHYMILYRKRVHFLILFFKLIAHGSIHKHLTPFTDKCT